jgi:hypothetical protein
VKKYDTFRQGTDGNTKHAIYMLNNWGCTHTHTHTHTHTKYVISIVRHSDNVEAKARKCYICTYIAYDFKICVPR